MAVNSRLISQNQIDTTYGANLDTQKQVAAPTSLPNQPIQQNVNTSYQANSGAQYGGHDATWWNEQYSAQADDNSRAMVAKAADYYGYKIPTEAQNNLSYASNVNAVKAVAPTQSQESVATPAANYSEPIDSYEEFLRKRAEMYQENLNKQNALIEEQKQNSLNQAELQRLQAQAQAEQERQKGVIEARSS